MAKRWAIANGTFSTASTWNDNAILGVPVTGDELWTNSFAIDIDQNFSAMSISSQAKSTRTSVISIMTGYVSPEGTASASTELNGTTNAAWKAFDATSGFWSTAAATTTGQLQFQFSSSRIIKAYDFTTSSTAATMPKSWTLEGSNNGSTWTTLDTQTNVVLAISTTWQSTTLANNTAYLYYRLNVSLNGGGTTLTLNTLNLYDLNEYLALVAGGQFTNTATRTVTITGGTIGIAGVAGTNSNALIAHNGSAATTLTLNLNGAETWSSTGAAAGWWLALTNSGNLAINGNITHSALGGTNSAIVRMNSAGNIAYTGNITVSTGTQGNVFLATAGNITIVGDVTQISNANSNAINFTGTNLSITGNVSAQNATSAITSTTAINLTITGNISNLGGAPAITSTGAAVVIIVGNATCSGTSAVANFATSLTSVLTISGVISNNSTNGQMAILSSRMFINSTASTWAFTATAGGSDRTLYAAGVFPNSPLAANVRQAITYGPGLASTGTLIVPSPSNVIQGVPTDNTVGTNTTTAALIAAAVRSNLATELARIDVATSTRNATVPDNTGIAAIKAKTDNLPSDPASNTTVSTRLASSSYTAPDNTSITAIKAKTDNLPSDPASNTVVNTRLASASYTAPDNSTISAIAAKTTNLPSDPASNTVVNTRLASSSYTAPDNTSITAIKAKTDQLAFTGANVNAIAQVVADKTGYALTSGERSSIAVAVEAALLNDGDGQALIAAIVAAIGNENITQSVLVAAIRADIERAGGMLDTLPVLAEIEASTVLAKEASVNALPTLTEIEASTLLAKEATVASVKSNTDLIPATL